MVDTIKILDPVKGLVDYVNDIKPYHSKVIESLVEYVGNEIVDVRVGEEYNLNIELVFDFDISKISCEGNGFGALPFGDPEDTLILSPDPTKTIIEYGAIQPNNFTVLGDQEVLFDTVNNLTFNITSFVEDKIFDITLSTGSPPTGGTFTVNGDQEFRYKAGDIFNVRGSFENDAFFKVTADSIKMGSPPVTIIPVEGQVISSTDISGFIAELDVNNNGKFTIINAIPTPGATPLLPFTTVFISGITLVPPNSLEEYQRYISIISTTGLDYKKIVSYSNHLIYYGTGSPPLSTHNPDEGIVYAPIVSLSQTTPAYFEVVGEFAGSNIFIGDEISVVSSSDNNAKYIITSITPIVASVGSPSEQEERTLFGVASIHDSVADGFVLLDIPSNSFILDGDFTDIVKQGSRITATTGSSAGEYNVLYSKFVNNETRIRVLESLITDRGPLILATTDDSFTIQGDHTSSFPAGSFLNVHGSLRNDNMYTVLGTGIGASLLTTETTTIITVVETVDATDATGEIHNFAPGSLKFRNVGFGQTPPLCEVIPETLVVVNIKDRLTIDNMGILVSDDIFAHGANKDDWGYDLPPTTIFASTEPPAPLIAVSAPPSPLEDTLWFDISINSGSPSGPGILKQYVQVLGSPVTFAWVEVARNKAYWVDTDNNYMYYRMIYQYYDTINTQYITPIDTGWILEYTKIPGFNDHIAGKGTRELLGFESFFAIESSPAVVDTIFNFAIGSPQLEIPLTTGSPMVPNPAMFEVTVNGTYAEADLLSQTSFEITAPLLRVNDYIEVKVFDDTGTASGVFVGSFNANTAIEEDFNATTGLLLNIAGTQVSDSTIHFLDPFSDIYAIFTGSPLDTVDIINSTGSPNDNGTYTISNVAQDAGSPPSYTILTVSPAISIDTGIFSGSPEIESGQAVYKTWFQYMIVNTTSNTITVLGDATIDVINGNNIEIIDSFGSPNPNDGVYSVTAVSAYNAANNTTIITVSQPITATGASGGWVI